VPFQKQPLMRDPGSTCEPISRNTHARRRDARKRIPPSHLAPNETSNDTSEHMTEGQAGSNARTVTERWDVWTISRGTSQLSMKTSSVLLLPEETVLWFPRSSKAVPTRNRGV